MGWFGYPSLLQWTYEDISLSQITFFMIYENEQIVYVSDPEYTQLKSHKRNDNSRLQGKVWLLITSLTREKQMKWVKNNNKDI